MSTLQISLTAVTTGILSAAERRQVEVRGILAGGTFILNSIVIEIERPNLLRAFNESNVQLKMRII